MHCSKYLRDRCVFSTYTQEGKFNYFRWNFGLNNDLVECSTQLFQSICKDSEIDHFYVMKNHNYSFKYFEQCIISYYVLIYLITFIITPIYTTITRVKNTNCFVCNWLLSIYSAKNVPINISIERIAADIYQYHYNMILFSWVFWQFPQFLIANLLLQTCVSCIWYNERWRVSLTNRFYEMFWANVTLNTSWFDNRDDRKLSAAEKKKYHDLQ